MPRVTIVRECPVQRTPRVLKMEGLFDLPPSQRSGQRWEVDFDLPDAWNVGLIVGPSGSGKTTCAREVFGDSIVSGWDWPADASLLDGFPAALGIKEIVELLSSVGFSSPPSWVRPYHVLSNGEQFRANMAARWPRSPGWRSWTSSLRWSIALSPRSAPRPWSGRYAGATRSSLP